MKYQSVCESLAKKKVYYAIAQKISCSTKINRKFMWEIRERLGDLKWH